MVDGDGDVGIPEAESAEDKFAAERSHKASSSSGEGRLVEIA